MLGLLHLISSPDLYETVAAGRVNRRVVLVKDEVTDRAIVRFDYATDLVALYVHEFDFTIGATNSDLLASLIEFTDMRDCVASVKISNFLNHTDIPDFQDTVRIARGNVLASN